jgi:hypothetical protein
MAHARLDDTRLLDLPDRQWSRQAGRCVRRRAPDDYFSAIIR